jgi:CRAL/TRIO domain
MFETMYGTNDDCLFGPVNNINEAIVPLDWNANTATSSNNEPNPPLNLDQGWESGGETDEREGRVKLPNWDDNNQMEDCLQTLLLQGGSAIIDPMEPFSNNYADPKAPLAAALAPSTTAVISETPTGMQLTRAEYESALAIKERIQKTTDIDNLPDMFYAQMAIVGEGNVDWAVQRARGLQQVRQEYQIVDNYEDGARGLTTLNNYFPGMILGVYYFERDGNEVLISDITKFDFSCWRDPNKMRETMHASYYIIHMMCPDLAAIRTGTVYLVECEGYSLRKDTLPMDVFLKIFNGLYANYPNRFKKIRYFHAPLLLRILHSILRKLLPPELHCKMQMRHASERRLDTMCMVPSVEEASLRVLEEMKANLKRRYDNERAFVL